MRGIDCSAAVSPAKALRSLTLVSLALLTFVPANGRQLRAQATLYAEKRKPATHQAAKPTQVKVKQNPKDGLNYVRIPPGKFMMGCSPGDNHCSMNEKPAHRVTISKGFWFGQTEVTVGAYKRFSFAPMDDLRAAPSFNPFWGNENMPIVRVSWDDARAFCTWSGGRLPTEAEWEYAARARSTKAYYGPLDETAWYDRNSGAGPHEVGQKRANAWGLFDTLGNVWEWVGDWYDENYYRKSPSVDPQGPTPRQYRGLRGGSSGQSAGIVRVTVRYGDLPGSRRYDVGFRCVEEAAAP